MAFPYSPLDLAFDCNAAGFHIGGGLVNALAIAGAESGYDPKATNTTGNTPPSTDRGIFQLNSYFHPEVTDACAFDPKCAAREAYRISTNGSNFGPWSTWGNGAYKQWLGVAWLAADAMQRLQGLQATASSQTLQINLLTKQLAGAQSQLASVTADDSSLATQLQAAQDALTAAQAETAKITAAVDAYLAGVRAQLVPA